MTPNLILEIDRDWDQNRPVPLEPTRWGKVHVNNPDFLNQHPLVSQRLKKNSFNASYFNPSVAKKLIKDEHLTVSKEDQSLLDLAQDLESSDTPSSWLINSLLFETKVYSQVEKHIHQRLLTATLGPSKSFADPIIKCILDDINAKSHKQITILDPCAGAGALSYLIAEALIQKHINRFEIVNADLSIHASSVSDHLVQSYYPQMFANYHSHIRFIQQDAINMDKVADSSLDYIVTLRALHEFTAKHVSHLITSAMTKLKPEGLFICLDVTRYEKILESAQKLLPLLGKFSSFSILMNQFQKTKMTNEHFLEIVMEGDPLFEQAGVQSYQSGFLLEELVMLLTDQGINPIHQEYINDPPVGAVFITAKKG